MSQLPGTAAPTSPAAKMSGLAIAGLACSVAAVCVLAAFGLWALVVGLAVLVREVAFWVLLLPLCGIGVLLGILATVQITKSHGQLTGLGMALTGAVVSGALPPLTLLGALCFTAANEVANEMDRRKAEAEAHAQHIAQMARVNMMHLCRAANQYAAANNDRFPPTDSWPQALKEGHAIEGDQAMTDPTDPSAGRFVAMNAALRDIKMSNVASPSQTVLFFECGPGGPMCGGPTDLPPAPRRSSGYLIGFCDGHVEDVKADKVGLLIWDPKAQ